MPHDLNNNELKPGDIVSMRFKVIQVTTAETFCNLTLESELPMTPRGIDRLTLSQVNSRQLQRVEK